MHRIITAESRPAVRGAPRPARGLALVLLVTLLPVHDGAAAGGLEIGAPFDFSPRDPSRLVDAGPLRVRGALTLRTEIDGRAIPREISGLAWSEDDRVLYAITDAGWLLQLAPRFIDDRLVGVTLLSRVRLADGKGHALPRRAADAEGLAALDAADGRPGNTRLLVSFEGTPVIAEHAPDGRRLSRWPLPAPLAAAAQYDSPNHGLEAIAVLPRHGYVVAPERPLRDAPHDAVMLYTFDGMFWRYPVDDSTAQSITGLDTLPDGTLLAVERRYSNPWMPIVCTLSRLHLSDAGLDVDVLARYSSALGWPVDNFEAIAYHRDGHFFIASDDNENPLQRGLLIYFELPPDVR